MLLYLNIVKMKASVDWKRIKESEQREGVNGSVKLVYLAKLISFDILKMNGYRNKVMWPSSRVFLFILRVGWWFSRRRTPISFFFSFYIFCHWGID